MMNKKILTVLVAVLVASTCFAGAKTILEIPFDKTTNPQRSGATFEMQDDDKPAFVFSNSAKPQSMMFFWLKKAQCQGKTFKISIMAKGDKLSKPFIFGLQARKDGKTIWPGNYTKSGTFDWKTFSFTINFKKLGIDNGAIRIGLQNSSGKLLVRNLSVEELPPTGSK